MLFDEDEATPLKKWIVKRLEDISDADSDVLADYVLALLRHDQPVDEVRQLCIDQLDDFLKEHTATFVTDLFSAISSKSYLPPGSAPAAPSPVPPVIFNPPTGPAAGLSSSGPNSANAGSASRNQSRKRAYHDRDNNDTWDGKDPHYGQSSGGDRAFKQARRGTGRGGRFDGHQNRGGRQGAAQPPPLDIQMSSMPGMPQPPPMAFPGMPQPPPGFPFDPNDPMAAFLTMQAMGFALPPMPFATAGSPTGFPPSGNQRSPVRDVVLPVKRIGERCRDYDEKGFCALGSTCPYEHGTNPIIVPGEGDEYDPNNSALATDVKKPILNSHNDSPGPNGSGERGFGRGSDRGGRGRGRGRGDNSMSGGRRGGRAEFSHAGPNNDRSITTVVVEAIPEDKFQEETVREFFSTFGNILDVQMQSYKRLALVKYADWASAKRAYDSPKVIFDNRFVKVYWYKPETVPKPPINTNGQVKAGSPTPSRQGGDAMEMEIDIEEFKKKQEEAQKAHEEKLRKKRETEDAKKELEKRREELLKKQAEEKKKLMERLAAKTASANKGSATSGTTKSGDDTNGATANGGAEGEQAKVNPHTEALKTQLAALEAEARSMGLDSALEEDPWSTRGRGRGRGAYRGRGTYVPRGRGGYEPTFRGGYRGRGPFAPRGRGGAMKLDNRTKKVAISVTQFDAKKDESLREYLLGIGEFESIEANPDNKDSQIITFKDRFTAEKFIYSGSEIPNVGMVELSWVNTPLPSVTLNKQPNQENATSAPTASTAPTAASHDDSAMADGDMHKANEDYDVAEDDDDRWMVE